MYMYETRNRERGTDGERKLGIPTVHCVHNLISISLSSLSSQSTIDTTQTFVFPSVCK